MATMCMENCTDGGILYELVSEEIWAPWNAALNYFEYQPWFFSLLGSLMVGLSGIFPLFIIPIDQGLDLKHGDSARTLNVLLSFAVGGLLGDVFLHLLPEAWANKSLNQWSEEGHASMACGLWVLAGFLLFVIAEKLFSGLANNEDDDDGDEKEEKDEEEEEEEEQQENKGNEKEEEETVKACDEQSLANDKRINKMKLLNNNNFQKELENNNCLMPNGNVKNGCVKSALMLNNGIMIMEDIMSKMNGGNCCGISNICKNLNSTNIKSSNGIIMDNRQSRNYKNIVDKSNKSEELNLISDKRNSSIDNDNKNKNDNNKSKHISGYLNLLANSIDNFTHGLAVGGAFLVSFRLGAFTTFAILVHEIPHEVGDFAILLKSGFNRWDAAKAQLLTAGGGILGALAAVLCSGGSVEARTSWILPFTAGGFLHIGLVTVLPELIKETNPKESFKQLAALVIGILLMAFMTAICD